MRDEAKAVDDAILSELLTECLREDGYGVEPFDNVYHRHTSDRAFFVTAPTGRRYVLKFNEN